MAQSNFTSTAVTVLGGALLLTPPAAASTQILRNNQILTPCYLATGLLITQTENLDLRHILYPDSTFFLTSLTVSIQNIFRLDSLTHLNLDLDSILTKLVCQFVLNKLVPRVCCVLGTENISRLGVIHL